MNWDRILLMSILELGIINLKVGEAEIVADRCNSRAALVFDQEVRLSKEYKKKLSLDLDQYIPTFTKILEYYQGFKQIIDDYSHKSNIYKYQIPSVAVLTLSLADKDIYILKKKYKLLQSIGECFNADLKPLQMSSYKDMVTILTHLENLPTPINEIPMGLDPIANTLQSNNHFLGYLNLNNLSEPSEESGDNGSGANDSENGSNSGPTTTIRPSPEASSLKLTPGLKKKAEEKIDRFQKYLTMVSMDTDGKRLAHKITNTRDWMKYIPVVCELPKNLVPKSPEDFVKTKSILDPMIKTIRKYKHQYEQLTNVQEEPSKEENLNPIRAIKIYPAMAYLLLESLLERLSSVTNWENGIVEMNDLTTLGKLADMVKVTTIGDKYVLKLSTIPLDMRAALDLGKSDYISKTITIQPLIKSTAPDDFVIKADCTFEISKMDDKAIISKILPFLDNDKILTPRYLVEPDSQSNLLPFVTEYDPLSSQLECEGMICKVSRLSDSPLSSSCAQYVMGNTKVSNNSCAFMDYSQPLGYKLGCKHNRTGVISLSKATTLDVYCRKTHYGSFLFPAGLMYMKSNCLFKDQESNIILHSVNDPKGDDHPPELNNEEEEEDNYWDWLLPLITGLGAIVIAVTGSVILVYCCCIRGRCCAKKPEVYAPAHNPSNPSKHANALANCQESGPADFEYVTSKAPSKASKVKKLDAESVTNFISTAAKLSDDVRSISENVSVLMSQPPSRNDNVGTEMVPLVKSPVNNPYNPFNCRRNLPNEMDD